VPDWHEVPERHAFPQPPQLRSSVWVSAQIPGPASLGQTVPPSPHALVQLPATQAMLLSHTTPHAPQFWPSDEVSAQYAPPASTWQNVLVPLQEGAHTPLEQTLPLGQA
jgi:hypothetical protein